MATPQHMPVPDQCRDYFWIPMLIRRAPDPASMASPLSDAVTEAIGSAATYATPCVAPANDTRDPSVADAGDSATAGSVLPAEGEASRALGASVDGEAEHAASNEEERVRPADCVKGPEAELPATCAADPETATEVREQPADSRVEQSAASLSRRRGRRAALVAAFTLAAAAIFIVAVPGLAGRLVSPIGEQSGASARPFAGANDVAREAVRADARPIIALPIARGPARAAAAAPVVHPPAPVASTIAVPEEPVAVVAVEPAIRMPVDAPSTAPVESVAVSADMSDSTGENCPAGEAAVADHPARVAAIEPLPAVEAAPVVPTKRSRSPRAPAQLPGMAAAHSAPIVPTSRDLLDVPGDVPADVPVDVPVNAPEDVPEEPPADAPAEEPAEEPANVHVF